MGVNCVNIIVQGFFRGNKERCLTSMEKGKLEGVRSRETCLRKNGTLDERFLGI